MSNFTSLLIANRGEIAVRVARTAASLKIRPVMVFSEDDALSPHLRFSDYAVALPARGPKAYLDIEEIVKAAVVNGCDAIHPGYGFLSENAAFAEACAVAGIKFVGPSVEALVAFGDKAAARDLAKRLDVPLLPGTHHGVTPAAARDFIESLMPGTAIMLKAVSGGGGRGMRIVSDPAAIDSAFVSCSNEAVNAFGNGDLYAEMMVSRARHIEIQVIGDGAGGVIHFGERECTLQRRHQKLVEIAPSPSLPQVVREKLCDAACRMAAAVQFEGLGTFEFLVDADDASRFWFMEANPRIQVEHTVTEEVCRLDLVELQLRIAAGQSFLDLGLSQADIHAPSFFAVQLRVNAETVDAGAKIRPSSGTILRYDLPTGPGVRVDDFARSGSVWNPNFDTLLAKIIVSGRNGIGRQDYVRTLERARRTLTESRISGVATNLSFLIALLSNPDVVDNNIHTRFVEHNWDSLVLEAERIAGEQEFDCESGPVEIGKRQAIVAPPGSFPIAAPLTGLITNMNLEPGTIVEAGQLLAVLEAMKMEHPVYAPTSGIVRVVAVAAGAFVQEGDALIFFEATAEGETCQTHQEEIDLDEIPLLLADELARRRLRMDDARPDSVARRHRSGQSTIRENIDALCDAGSFVEYGGLALPSQRKRRSMEELIIMGPADGLVGGTATIGSDYFPGDSSQCMVVGYDYMAFAGTQGWANHKKLGRLLKIVGQNPRPLIIFAEGGGGRPGETDQLRSSGLDNTTFANFARLSGRAPLIGIVAGRCFAGNAALLGCCDVIIAARNSTIGMGGPAMIEGGGLGRFTPEEVGPISVQIPNGVIDIVADDEIEAIALAKKYLGYFQGVLAEWECADQRLLRHLVPENGLRTYDVRRVIETLADRDSLLELRPEFGRGLVTMLARIEGRPVGILANNTRHMSGAIDSAGSDKGARFLRLCDTFDLPVISLCDTPGFMVGPDSESTAAVRHMSRLFLAGANLSVPLIAIVLRKAFGLGAMAMAGGSMHETMLTVAWPTAQFGGMGLEGAVRLGYRRELEAIDDPQERLVLFNSLVAKAYEDGKAHNAASFVEIDDVIDPAVTRHIVAQALRGLSKKQASRRTNFIDSW